jgi:dipeptidase D
MLESREKMWYNNYIFAKRGTKMNVCELNPKKVFEYFALLSSVPHGSGNMKPIADLCENFAKERGLEYIRDAADNVIIKKPGTAGYEDSEPLILQGHLDMVCAKDPDCEKDMATEPIELYVDGDYLRARGTSLGGDNIIAVAMTMAILDSDDIPHPPIEAVFTVDEEVGLLGASALDFSNLKAKRMINLDSEEEGVFTVCCAGGVRVNATIPLTFENVSADSVAYKITVSGLMGGHSGVDIDKGRESANRLIIRFLKKLGEKLPFGLYSLEGGQLDNVICPEANAVIVFKNDEAEIGKLLESVAEYDAIFKNELAAGDPGVKVTASVCGLPASHVIVADTARALAALHILPYHIQRMSRDFEGLVQTSLNMGVLKLTDTELKFSYSVRSSIASEKHDLVDKIKSVLALAFPEAKIDLHGDYPSWEYKRDSSLRDVIMDAYCETTGKKGIVAGTHGGLECGIFSERIKGLDCVSMGPNLAEVHSPREMLDIPSVERLWELMKVILKKMK